MAYCIRCGKELAKNTAFCPSCGLKKEIYDEPARGRREEWTGMVQKCPACGQVVESFSAYCPACGSELRGAKPASAVE